MRERSEHTPGPWMGNGGSVVRDYGWTVQSVTSSEVAMVASNTGNNYPDEPAANLALIVAAPDLLEMCELALKQLGPLNDQHQRDHRLDHPVLSPLLDCLVAVIEKAKGQGDQDESPESEAG